MEMASEIAEKLSDMLPVSTVSVTTECPTNGSVPGFKFYVSVTQKA